MNREHRKDDWNIETAREEALHDAVEQARRLDELYEAACADIGDLQGKMDRLRAENERLCRAVASSMERAVKAEAAFALMRELIGVLSNSFDEGDRRRDELRRIYNSAALSVLTEAKGEKP